MATEYDTDAALVTFRCGGADPNLFLVSRWSGEEGISQPYRFDIELASADDSVDLNGLLGSRATLTVRTDAGAIKYWHGIVTELKQTYRDETYAHYRAVLEPQLALLRLFRQSRVYVHDDAPSAGKPDLSSVIRMALKQCGLTQEGGPGPGNNPHFSIRVSDADIKATASSFICQFEETSLDFLSRRLEHEGVYYWFEQGRDQEVVVFGNARDQQPVKDLAAIWRPNGELNPEPNVIAVSRFDHTVSVQPRGVVLRDFSVSQPSLDLTAKADIISAAPSSERFDSLGSIEVYGSNYKKQQRGEGLATVRAEEVACQRNQYFVQARAIGISAGDNIVLQQHFRKDFNTRYYVIHAQHEGRQSLPRQTMTETDDQAFYNGSYTVLPQEVQFRPSRRTAKPRVVGFVSAIVGAEGDGQYAQIDKHGCYRIRFLFAPPGSGQQDDANSAWVRMATPYAGGQHGMNFPLLKGTEVLVSFLGGDPDRPVIVSAIPNEENPSIRNQDNATQPGLRTAGQNALEFEDKHGHEHARLSSPASCTSLHLGTDPKNPEQTGIRMTTGAHIGITGQSYIQQIPSVYHMEIGMTGKVDQDEESRLAFKAAQDEQMARLIEKEALLPTATPALQLKALGKKLAASASAIQLLELRMKKAKEADPIDQDVINGLWKEIDAAQKAQKTLSDLIRQVGDKEITADEALKKVSDKKAEAEAEKKKPSPIVNTTFLGVKNTKSASVNNTLSVGNSNTLAMSVATGLTLGASINIGAAASLNLKLGIAKEFALDDKKRTVTTYLKKSVRDEVKTLKRETQVAQDQLKVGKLDQFVLQKYTCATNGPYSIQGTSPLGTIKLASLGGAAYVNVDSAKLSLGATSSLHLTMSNNQTRIVLAPTQVVLKAPAMVNIESKGSVSIKGNGVATMEGGVIKIG